MNRWKWTGALLFGFALLPALFSLGCVVRRETTVITAPDEGGGEAGFYIQNQSNETICYVNVSLTQNSHWGPDRLGASETIQPGFDRGWGVAPGYYDFRLQDCQHHTMMERRSVAVSAEGVTITFRERE